MKTEIGSGRRNGKNRKQQSFLVWWTKNQKVPNARLKWIFAEFYDDAGGWENEQE